MQVLPEYNAPYIIDSLTAPLVIKRNWIFNAQMLDFMLSPITYLEETTGAAIKVRINGSEFWVPASWYILVADTETAQIDTVSIQDCTKKKHTAFSFSPDESNLRVLDIEIAGQSDDPRLLAMTQMTADGDSLELDAAPPTSESPIDPCRSVVHPMIAKGTALVHPVGPVTLRRRDPKTNQPAVIQLSVVIGPHDLWKFIGNKIAGDILS